MLSVATGFLGQADRPINLLINKSVHYEAGSNIAKILRMVAS